MNKFLRGAGKQVVCAGTSLIFLFVHVSMLIIFAKCEVSPMYYFNIFSIAYYLASFFLIYRDWLNLYVILTYYEVVAHMSSAVYFVGWDPGFQITLIGMNVLAFFAEYVSRTIEYGKGYVPAMPLCIVGMVMYLSLYILRHGSPAPYILPDEYVFWLNVAWCVIVFTIVIICLQGFVLLTFYSELELSEQAGRDQLTGLPNRYAMTRFLKNAVKKGDPARRWLAIGDIDGFKQINDTYGHNCGDYVLKTLAEILSAFEGCDEICRWGGEEFLFTGKVTDDMDGVKEMLDRLRTTVSEHSFWYDELKLNITITIGVVEQREDENLIEWVNRADKELYTGKTNGKNQVVAG